MAKRHIKPYRVALVARPGIALYDATRTCSGKLSVSASAAPSAHAPAWLPMWYTCLAATPSYC